MNGGLLESGRLNSGGGELISNLEKFNLKTIFAHNSNTVLTNLQVYMYFFLNSL